MRHHAPGKVAGATALAVAIAWGCTSSPAPPPTTPTTADPLLPGEVCDPTVAHSVVVHFDPLSLVLAPGQTRPVKLVVDPDLCAPLVAGFSMGDSTRATAPDSATLDLRHPSADFYVTGVAAGSTSLTVSVQRPVVDAAPFTGTLPIVVQPDAAPATCASGDQASATLGTASPSMVGTGSLAAASLSVPPGAFTRTDELALPSFSATVACAGGTPGGTADLTAAAAGAPLALGPAVTFTPQDPTWLTHSLKRELDFAVPVNPAAMPVGARMRHVVVLYAGPRARVPRAIPVANPTFAQTASGQWALRFESPWFGTYQAAVVADAATVQLRRHLTHRAVLGISMGGGGAAIFGMRHHDQFDAIAPLGGNSDLTWLVWYFEQFKFGGFCPVANPGCPTYAPNLYPLDETYAHTEDFDHWFFQPGGGTGGSFSRQGWTQILEDFLLMGGNPNGQNADPAIPFIVTGPTSTDPFVSGVSRERLPRGLHPPMPHGTCDVTIDPIGPSADDTPAQQAAEATAEAQQQAQQSACAAARCEPANAWIARTGFYDAAYNPDGSRPVISFCDGGQNGTTPYVDTWAPSGAGDQIPTDFTLAVDLNGNGIRDLGEPVIRQGEEPYQDTGTDGVADADEPGFDALANPDPAGDDYDFQLNPGGTENDHTWEAGEPYEDVGLDGVKGTPQQADGGYDIGEGDGRFTLSSGAQRLYQVDPHAILHGRSAAPGGPVDAAALSRLNVWADGGVRDMANFAAVANHFLGAVATVKQASGSPARSTAFYNNFENLPGSDPTQPDQYAAGSVLWDDVARAAHLRYGTVDATAAMIAQGDGQHVGSGDQIIDRLVTGFYFASHAWPDADRTLPDTLTGDPGAPGGNGETTTVNELGTSCELLGHCETYFTGPRSRRVGPVAVTLPPGYALEANRARDERYPVLFVLHGYGQDPRDLEATAAITDTFMNDATKSAATRLTKMIVVYVDGRCRIDPTTGAPECIRGTFYLNSPRSVDGRPIGQLDDWFEEVMAYVDANYRTMGPSDVPDVQ